MCRISFAQLTSACSIIFFICYTPLQPSACVIVPALQGCAAVGVLLPPRRVPEWDTGGLREKGGQQSARRIMADTPVDRFSDEVGVAIVACVLLDHVEQDVAQAGGWAVGPASPSRRAAFGH